MPKLIHAISGGVEPIILPAIKCDKLEQHLRDMIQVISPADPMAINVYYTNFF
ncbi:MAG: hypothetical protein ACR5K2_00800 [Wolbachia sp.]